MPPATMEAAVSQGPRRIGVGSLPVPEPAAGDVRVRVGACGLCGSDLHLFHAGALPAGAVPGHEFMGTVDSLGEGVPESRPELRVGQRVAVEPFRTCGACVECRSGRGHICRQGHLLGVHEPGGMAGFVTAPAGRLFPVPEDLPAHVAALAEPLSVSLHGLRRVALAPGQRVLVLGAGAVGLLTALAARFLGAGEVIVTARHPHQAEAAEAMGAHRVLREAEAGAEGLDRLGRERPVDVVVETVGGGADTLDLAGIAVRPGGSVCVLGLFLAPVSLQTLPLMMKEATLAWSYCYEHGEGHADFADAVGLLDARRSEAERLVTHRFPLSEVERAFQVAADRKAGAIKVSLEPA